MCVGAEGIAKQPFLLFFFTKTKMMLNNLILAKLVTVWDSILSYHMQKNPWSIFVIPHILTLSSVCLKASRV